MTTRREFLEGAAALAGLALLPVSVVDLPPVVWRETYRNAAGLSWWERTDGRASTMYFAGADGSMQPACKVQGYQQLVTGQPLHRLMTTASNMLDRLDRRNDRRFYAVYDASACGYSILGDRSRSLYYFIPSRVEAEGIALKMTEVRGSHPGWPIDRLLDYMAADQGWVSPKQLA